LSIDDAHAPRVRGPSRASAGQQPYTLEFWRIFSHQIASVEWVLIDRCGLKTVAFYAEDSPRHSMFPAQGHLAPAMAGTVLRP
jgi:hypothetical protein